MIGFPKERHPGTHLGGQVRQLRAMKDQRAKIEHVAATSGDVLEAQLAALRSVFPDVFVEGKIDFDKLRATLGAAAESGPGRFHFSWAGKDDAVSLLQTPSRGTLIPCPDESINFDTTGNAFIEGDNLEVLKLLFKPSCGIWEQLKRCDQSWKNSAYHSSTQSQKSLFAI